MSAAAALKSEIDATLAALAQDAQAIATILSEGPAANLTRTRMLHANANRQMMALTQLMIKAGQLPSGDDPHVRMALQGLLAKLPAEIAVWQSCDALLADQVPPEQRPLFPPVSGQHDVSHAPIIAADELLMEMHHLISAEPQSDQGLAHGCFGDIPLPFSVFFENALAARRVLLARRTKHGGRFLDIGCGAGMKVLAATRYFERCHGIEFDPTFAAAARDLFDRTGKGQCGLTEGDALTYEGYGDFDVIYLFRPMRDPALLEQLEDRVIAQVPTGTLIIAPYRYFGQRYRAAGCAHLGGKLYVTGMSQDQADQLAEAASFTGLSLPGNNVPANSIWTPILRACAARGFEPRTKPADVTF